MASIDTRMAPPNHITKSGQEPNVGSAGCLQAVGIKYEFFVIFGESHLAIPYLTDASFVVRGLSSLSESHFRQTRSIFIQPIVYRASSEGG